MTMSNRNLKSAWICAIALSVSACDSAVIFSTVTTPELGAALAQTSENLLLNGGFETFISDDDWRSCSPVSDINTDAAPSEGAGALSLSNGSCVSQTITAIAGATYTLNCEGMVIGDAYSSIAFGFIDESSSPIEVQELAIISADYSPISSTLTAPAAAQSAEVLIYSDAEAIVDNCSVIRLADASLINGDFSADLNGWQTCDNGTGDITILNNALDSSNKQLAISNGGCISQTTDISEPLSSRSDLTIKLGCDALTSGDGYSSITLAYLDGNSQPLSTNEVPISSASTGGVFASSLAAPAEAHFAQITLYSEGFSIIDNCSIAH
ncbi:hypothetical protein AB833_17765 [Chromatiales bacterium (ex Bugula neritina AB1)]|nr:hypothetical protein AB833_17765 [Chromatiales bacterium (ex Bugula neritina AB1)]